jgi:NDP-sugar pyrophosphorylase family protein
MKAMVLSAGLGTRLRPLTLEKAKPAIPVLGKPLIIRLIQNLTERGCSEFRVNLHHLPESIESLFEVTPWDELPVSFSHEQDILGTAGGLKANESFFDQGTFLMVNGDILFDFPLTEALAFHRQRQALATLILVRQEPPYRYSPVRIDENNRLVDFKGSGSTDRPRPETYVFTGVHILEPAVFGYIPPRIFYEINAQVYPVAMRGGERVLGLPVAGYWNDLGDPIRYLEAQRDLFRRLGTSSPVHMAPGASADPSSRIGPFVTVGDGCVIEADCMAENAVFWEHVRVKSGTIVRNCVIGSELIVASTCSNKIITRHGEAPIA